MLEAFINARDRFLKNGGLVMPSRGDIFAQPITDGQLWQEQEAKASFWRSTDFHGVDLSALHDAASTSTSARRSSATTARGGRE